MLWALLKDLEGALGGSPSICLLGASTMFFTWLTGNGGFSFHTASLNRCNHPEVLISDLISSTRSLESVRFSLCINSVGLAEQVAGFATKKDRLVPL